jgi:hypothetical protein
VLIKTAECSAARAARLFGISAAQRRRAAAR